MEIIIALLIGAEIIGGINHLIRKGSQTFGKNLARDGETMWNLFQQIKADFPDPVERHMAENQLIAAFRANQHMSVYTKETLAWYMEEREQGRIPSPAALRAKHGDIYATANGIKQ